MIQFGSIQCCALIDTGAQVSLVREDVYNSLPDCVKHRSDHNVSSIKLRGVGGGCSSVVGVARLTLTLADRAL